MVWLLPSVSTDVQVPENGDDSAAAPAGANAAARMARPTIQRACPLMLRSLRSPPPGSFGGISSACSPWSAFRYHPLEPFRPPTDPRMKTLGRTLAHRSSGD